MVSKSEFKSQWSGIVPRDEENMNFLFNSDIVNLLLKTNVGKDKRPNFVIFIASSALIVLGGW